MTRRVFSDGVLLEEWDDEALVFGHLDAGVWKTRPYTPEEVAAVAPTQPEPDRLEEGLDDLTVALLAAL